MPTWSAKSKCRARPRSPTSIRPRRWRRGGRKRDVRDSASCRPERSEGPCGTSTALLCNEREILRFAQDDSKMSFDVAGTRRQFPILSEIIDGRPIHYLDNGASAQTPLAVLDAVRK